MSPSQDYDVIVLGGGSAGSSAAAAASEAGARTLMLNDGELGGLCILRGCMPTKAMLASAHALHETQHVVKTGSQSRNRWSDTRKPLWNSGMVRDGQPNPWRPTGSRT